LLLLDAGAELPLSGSSNTNNNNSNNNNNSLLFAKLSCLSSMPKDVQTALAMLLKRCQQMRQNSNSKVTTAQIGANDGVTNDPLCPVVKMQKDSFVGLLVEPTPKLYQRLRNLHSKDSANGLFTMAWWPRHADMW
jgi:hypothetical protein